MNHTQTYMETHYGTKTDKTTYAELYAKYVYNKYFKKIGKVLDFGCNNGIYMEGFKKIGCDCCGVDINEDQINVCLNKGLEARLFNIEKKSIPYPDEKFDFIFFKSTIEHIPLPNILPILIECKRVLKKDGKIFILTDEWKRCYKTFYDDTTHITPMTKKKVNQLD